MDNQELNASAVADADLVLRTRSGDTEAFGELWRRHYRSGLTVARSVTSSIEPDDLVQESYSRIYQAILKGGGPNGSFRAYLFTSIRNTAAAWGRARRETTIDELDTVADPDSTDAAENEELDRGLTAQAFRSLPSRWQEVLWYSEIERMKPAAIGSLLGMSAGAVSQLTFRAREGLREAWIQAHLRSVGEGSECQQTIEQLGAHARGNLGLRAQQRVDRHLENCARCMIVFAEAKDVSSRLTMVLLPLVLGVSGASAYLATLQGGGTPIVALAAMPSSVIEGAVVASGGAATAAGAGGASGSGAGASTGAGGTAGGSGGVTGIGALVGAGTAALMVAGVVAAAAVVPGMLNAAPATSNPSASEEHPLIPSEVSPDPALSEAPVNIQVAEPAPREQQPQEEAAEPAPQPPAAVPTAPPAPVAPLPDPGPEPATPEPEKPKPEEPAPEKPVVPTNPEGPGDGGTTPTDPTDPTDPEGPGDGGTTPTDPTDPTTPTTPEGPGEGGTTDPGGGGTGTPGGGPDEGPGPVTPALPAGTPTLGAGRWTIDVLALSVHYAIPVTGAAGQSVRADFAGTTQHLTLNAQGASTLQLRPTWRQACDDAPLSYSYVAGDLAGSVTTVRLSELGVRLPPAALCR